MESMRLFLPILMLSFAFQANARIVDKSELREYKIAAMDALNSEDPQNYNKCRMTGTETYESAIGIISVSDELEIAEGGQPLLIFSLVQPDYTYKVHISTDVEYKRITSLKILEGRMKDVNHGNLNVPKLVNEFVIERTVDCK